MSLKLAELQIAIPKTFDAGKVADQIQQQSAINQSNAQAASEKQLEKIEKPSQSLMKPRRQALRMKKENEWSKSVKREKRKNGR